MSRKRKKKLQQEGVLNSGVLEVPKTVYIKAITKKLEPEEPLSSQEVQELIQARIKEQDEVILPKRREDGQVTREWRFYEKRRGIER
jgi:hypothetical protein